ncbi:transporter substrate-binding domain-containing protein [Pseudomonas sp. NPDC007930]|uniref:transporter substrate-binding domain-containing protein n=1 Tax=Pseudomonas sp. NPDC007930 TaxID=3364417 RepID=UPI0036E08763
MTLNNRVKAPAALQARLLLSEADRQWLAERQRLRVGVSEVDLPPFELAGNGAEYEGLSADTMAALAQMLGLRVELVPLASREQAYAALAGGRIDLLGSANAHEAHAHGARLSLPYVPDQAALVRRTDDNGSARPGGLRLAMLADYLPRETVQALYPGARVQVYGSLLAALGAVSFGQADAALGNTLALRAQLNRSQFNNLRLAQFPPAGSEGLGLALNPGEAQLARLLDAALEALGEPWRLRLLRGWGLNTQESPEPRVLLSDAERAWVGRHPRVRVALNSHYVPVAWFDEQQQLRGIAGDVLSRISQLTGLEFVPVPQPNLPGLLGAVERGEADMAASVPATEALREHLRFSRPWLASSQVLVTRAEAPALQGLSELQGKRLAIPQSSPSFQAVAVLAPGVERHLAGGDADSLARVAGGQVDAALLPLISARALIARDYNGQLKIDTPLAVAPVRYRFALPAEAATLQGILDKALASLSVQELESISHRWRGDITVGVSPWPHYALWIVLGLVGSLALFALAMGCLDYQRRLIRERRQVEARLTDQLEFMRVMIDGTPHPLYVRDREGRLLNCNASYLQALGVTREQVIGRRSEGSVPLVGGQSQAFEALYRDAIATGEPVVGDRRITLRGGPELTIYHWLLPYRDHDGEAAGLICGWVDVTDRQKLFEELHAAMEVADAANQAKTRFLATASHEIRTPMNAVLGMLELARRHAEQGQLNCLALEVATEAAKGLLELLNDVLDVTRLESGHLALQPQPLRLDRLVANGVHLFQPQARQKGLSLSWEGPAEPLGVMADPVRLRQVLSNLLSNAIKFTERGEVQVSVQARASGDSLHVRLWVTDTGIGIPEADIARLGQPYCQASNHGQGGRAGAGLGLSISQKLCELMGGRLRLRSTLGQGTCAQVSLRLPRCQVPGEPALAAWQAPHAPQPLDILVIDDYPPNRLLLDQQLRYLGHRVILAESAQAGLAAWRAGRYDRVICDCNMPGMSGCELAQALRAEERQGGRAPVRLLGYTADPSPALARQCLAAGMDQCLVKPLGLAELAEALAAPDAQPADADALFDGQSLWRMSGGDDQGAEQLRQSLLASLRADLAQLREVGAASDVVHRVLGGARIIKAQALIDACEAAREDPAQVAGLIGSIEALIEAL